MYVESMVLLKDPPVAIGPAPSRDFSLGEVSDGVMLAGTPPSRLSLGLYVELLYGPEETGSFEVELFAREVGGAGRAWYLDRTVVEIPAVDRDADWVQPFNVPLPFDIELTTDVLDLDLFLIVTVDSEPSGLRNLYVRPQLPDAAP